MRRSRLHLPESDLEIALIDWSGDGPLALLHHANGFCAALWDLVARPLSRHFHVIGMDARGHGDSSKPRGDAFYRWENFGRDLAFVAETLAEAHDGRVALGLGHSFGGTSMLMASAARPGLFQRLVLVDPVLPPPGVQGDAAPERAERGHRLVESARQRTAVWPSRQAAREKWADKPLFAGWRPEAFALYLDEGMADRDDGQVELKCSPEVEAAIFSHGPILSPGQPSDPWALAARVPTPTLLLWATRGDFPRFVYEKYASLLPDGQVRDVEAGHLVPMEQPEAVVREALAFAGIQDPPSGSTG